MKDYRVTININFVVRAEDEYEARMRTCLVLTDRSEQDDLDINVEEIL